MIGSLMAVMNVVLALGLLGQCVYSLNKIRDSWVLFVIHVLLATLAGLLAFRGADWLLDLALDIRTIVGRTLFNLFMIALWVLIFRDTKRKA